MFNNKYVLYLCNIKSKRTLQNMKSYLIVTIFIYISSLCNIFASNSDIKDIIRKAENGLYTNPQQTVFLASKALTETDDKNDIVKLLFIKALAERLLGNNDESLYSLYKIDLNSFNQESNLKGEIYNLMSICYCAISDFQKAIELNDNAVSIFKANNDSTKLASAYNNKGLIHNHMNENVQSEKFLLEALKINRAIKNFKGISANLNNLCLYHGNLEKQKEYIQEAIIINKNLDAQWSLAENYNNLGRLYIYENDYGNAQKALAKAYTIANEIGAKGIICDNYEYYSILYDQSCNYQKAFEYQSKLNSLKQELLSENNLRKIELNIAEEKLNEVIRENEIKKQEYRIQRLEKNIYGIIIISSLVTIITILLTQRSKRKKKLALIKAQYKLEQSQHEIARQKVNLQNMELMNAQLTLENNKQQMTNMAAFLKSRNELLEKIKELIKQGYKLNGNEVTIHLKKINAIITQYQDNDKTNSLTLKTTNDINNDFLERLEKKHPKLTNGEKHLACLLRTDMSAKEIAILTGTTPKTINMNRYRLRKALNLNSETDLTEYIKQI